MIDFTFKISGVNGQKFLNVSRSRVKSFIGIRLIFIRKRINKISYKVDKVNKTGSQR